MKRLRLARVSFDPWPEADISCNDFNPLFANLFPGGLPIIPGGDIFPAVIGGTAFKQVAPAQCLNISVPFRPIVSREQAAAKMYEPYAAHESGPAVGRDDRCEPPHRRSQLCQGWHP
jgi:hypothetical protein